MGRKGFSVLFPILHIMWLNNNAFYHNADYKKSKSYDALSALRPSDLAFQGLTVLYFTSIEAWTIFIRKFLKKKADMDSIAAR